MTPSIRTEAGRCSDREDIQVFTDLAMTSTAVQNQPSEPNGDTKSPNWDSNT